MSNLTKAHWEPVLREAQSPTSPQQLSAMRDLGVANPVATALARGREYGSFGRKMMSSPPTITVSAPNAATQISDGVYLSTKVGGADNGSGQFVGATVADWFSVYGGNPVISTSFYPVAGGLILDSLHVVNGQNMPVMEFVHYGAKLEFHTCDNARSADMILVDGEAIPYDVNILGNGGNSYRILFDFGTAKRRVIRYCGALTYGVTIEADAQVLATSKGNMTRVIVIGDSFTEGTGSATRHQAWAGYVQLLGEKIGWDVWTSGSGGTGYLAVNSGSNRPKFRDRIVEDCLQYNPDIIIIAGSINDGGHTAEQVGVEAGLLYDQIIAALPNVKLIIVGPLVNSVAAVTTYKPIEDALMAQAASHGALGIRALSIWNKSGFNSAIVSGDGTHPSAFGHEVIAEFLYEQLRGRI